MTSLTSQSGQAAARAEPMALPMLQRSWAKIKQAQLWGNMCLCESDRWRLLDNSLAFKGLNFKRVKDIQKWEPARNHTLKLVLSESVFRPSTTGMPSACRPSKSCWHVDWTWTSMLWAKSSGSKWRNPLRSLLRAFWPFVPPVFFPQVASRLPFCGWLQRTTTWRHF